MLEAHWENTQDIDVLVLEGRFDGLGSQAFDRAVEEFSFHTPFLLIDCDGVTYLSSAGVRSLIKLEKHLRKKNGGTVLFSLQSEVRWVLEVSGLLNHFCIVQDRDEALVHVTRSREAMETATAIDCGGRSCTVRLISGKETPFDLWDFNRRGTLAGTQADHLTGIDLDDLELGFGWGGLGGNKEQGLESLGMLITIGKVAGVLPADGFNQPDFLVLREAGEVLAYVHSVMGFSGDPWGVFEIPAGSPVTLAEIAQRILAGVGSYTGKQYPLVGLAFAAEAHEGAGTVLREVDAEGHAVFTSKDISSGGKIFGAALYGTPECKAEPLLDTFLSVSGDSEEGKEFFLGSGMILSGFPQQEDIRVPQDIEKFLPGLDVLLDVTGLNGSNEVTGGKVWVFLPRLIRSGDEKLVTIELIGDDPFPAEWDIIARRLYPDAGRVILEPLRGGFSNAKPFRVVSYDRQGKRMLPTVLKVGPTEQITREITAHERFVAPYILNNATTIMGTTGFGKSRGIRYNFVGISGPESSLTWLTKLYRERSTEELLSLFDTIFTRVLKPWYGQPHWETIYPYKEHDPLPNFSRLLDAAEEELGLNRRDDTIHCPEIGLTLPNPFRFLAEEYPLRRSQSRLWYTGINHGDLNMQNLLLDERENIYIIDFSETRNRNIVSDFARLEPIFKFEMTRLENECDLEALLEFERGLTGIGSLDEKPPFIYAGDDPMVERAYRMICRVRQYAKTVVIFETDLVPYLLAMLEWTYSVMAYKGFPVLRKKLAAYSAGLIVEQLMRLSP